MVTHRTVAESPLYTELLARIEPNVETTDLAYGSVKDEVATRAESFPQIAGTPLRYLQTRGNLAGGCPALWVYFTIDSPDLCTLQVVVPAKERAAVSIFRDS